MTIFYWTGFETGDGSELPVLGTGASIQTTTVRTGGYALKQDNTAGQTVFTNTISTTKAVARVYFRFDFSTPAGSPGRLISFDLTVSGNPLLVMLNASRQLVVSDSVAATTTGATVLAINTWYRIELICDMSVPNGVLKVLLNGATEINTTDSSGSTDTILQVRTIGDTAGNQYWDDVRIDTATLTAIGAGMIIARQGIAGTPTYDAWTKNGAATAALCWSETPFATGKNCSDNVLNDAQTMVVDKFSFDPLRSVEGAQGINTGDTINAVKVGIVAKTAVAGNITIRRRVGGADTDATVALTTSDAYRETAFFTDTVPNLDAYEIGVKNPLTATTETVEDMWMMVDFTGTGVAVPRNAGLLGEHSRDMPALRRAPVMIAY